MNETARRIAVCKLDELPTEGNKAFTIEGRSVLICQTSAGVFAVDNRCTHQLAALEGGRVRGVHLFCPKHGARFDLRTGVPNGMTTIPIRTYPLSVIEGGVEIEMT